MGTLAYYRLGFREVKVFIKNSVIDNILHQKNESNRSLQGIFGRATAPQYGRIRQYVWRLLKRYSDGDIVKTGQVSTHKLGLGLKGSLEETKLDGANQKPHEIVEVPQFYREQNPVKKLHYLFSYLSDRYYVDRKYWKGTLARVLSALLEFPEYVQEQINVINNEEDDKINDDANKNSDLDITVIVPAYNEEKWIKRVLESIFDQTQPPKKVIVMDDCSTDNTPNICRELESKCGDLVYLRQIRRRGKAYNLNVATQLILKNEELYSPITVFVDASGFLEKDFIEKIKASFNREDVAAASGSGAVIKPESLKGRLIFEKCELMFKIYKFRKIAQNYRNTVTPVCGGCVAYRTEVLKDIPIPERTHTEDTDHTWLLLEGKQRLVHNPKAVKHCVEPRTFNGFFKQWYRWYAGTFQCLFLHGRYLLKAKTLFFSTILPGLVDGFAYTGFLFLAIPLYFVNPELFIAASLWDLFLTGVLMALIRRHELKSLVYLPMVWIMKFPLIVTWLIACFKTTWQFLTHRKYLWRFHPRAWKRPDAIEANEQRLTAQELALGLKDLQEEIKMLTAERQNLLVKKKTFRKEDTKTTKA